MTALVRRGYQARRGAAAIAHWRRSWRTALMTGVPPPLALGSTRDRAIAAGA
jgi:hypothetical protein